MLGSELSSRAQKIEREQKQRLEREKQKAEKERILQDRAKQQRRQHEEEASRRRAAAIAAAELERLQHDEDLEHNNGVWWRAELTAKPITEQTAKDKGIKRGTDKIVLPPSASPNLMAQDAPKNGAMFFELRTARGTATHAGLLDFTAGEGTVGIPQQVSASLFPNGILPTGEQVTVTYRRLEKGTYTRLQPRTADFQKEVVEAMEDVLVAALSKRSTITEGDWLAVEFGERLFQLRVQQLRPARQVSVIDTEMEAEVEPSIETEERLKREAEEAQLRKAELDRLEADAEAKREAEAAAILQEAAHRERLRKEKEASLPQEPAAEEPSTNCLVRFPDGTRHARRFRHKDPLALLFHFVDAKGGGGAQPGGYKLVTQFPRRALSSSFEGTIAEAGLDLRQEALMLEPTSQSQE